MIIWARTLKTLGVSLATILMSIVGRAAVAQRAANAGELREPHVAEFQPSIKDPPRPSRAKRPYYGQRSAARPELHRSCQRWQQDRILCS